MTKEEAIRILRNIAFQFGSVMREDNIQAVDMAIEALSAESETLSHEEAWKQIEGDLISRADAKQQISEWATIITKPTLLDKDATMVVLDALPSAVCDDCIWHVCNYNKVDWDALPSAEAVQGWRIGKPTEQGEYMVTLDSFGHKRIDLFYYGKPMMPNRKVRGKCWYRSDDEWGDVVYDDKDILAWMPLPKPYKGGELK